MTHSNECLENLKKQEAEQDAWATAEFERLTKAGVDMSMRGFGFKYKCTCKTQETQ